MEKSTERAAKHEKTLTFFHEPAFDDAEAVQVILGPAPDEEDLATPDDPIKGADPEVVSTCSYRLLTKEQETHLFRKLNCLKYLAFMASDDERNDRLAHASSVRNVILKHNLRLVFTVAKAYEKPPYTVMELMSEAVVWMMQEFIDGYDYRLGVPFGGFLAGCLRKRLWGYLDAGRREREVTVDYELSAVQDHRRGSHEVNSVEDEFEKLREYLYANIKDEKTLDILCRRLGLNDGHMQGFQEIAKSYGVRWQTIQQQFDAAMVKLFGHTVNGNFIRTLQGRKKDNDRRREVSSVRLRHADV